MSNVGKWNRWYELLGDDPQPYGDSVTYALGAEWLAGCHPIEDWGCGKGWMRRFVPVESYRGVDGSNSPFADEIVDLSTYRSQVEGIFMRHVLEHNYDWARVLDNAVASFTRRMALVLFTPVGSVTREIDYADDPGVPDISFALPDLTEHLVDVKWRHETHQTPTQYGEETILFMERT